MATPNPFDQFDTVEQEAKSTNPFDQFDEPGRAAQPQAPEQASAYPPLPGQRRSSTPIPQLPAGQQAQAPEEGRLSSYGGAYLRGFGQIIASLPKAVGEGAVSLANKFGDDPLWGNPDNITPEQTASYQAGESIEKWFNKFILADVLER